jgi:hypothetical protein
VRGTWAIVLVSSACGFSPHAAGRGSGSGDAAGGDDGMQTTDALADAPPGQVCFGSRAYDRICYLAADVPTGAKLYQVSTNVNTDDGPTCNGNANLANTIPGNPCIIAAGEIELSGSGELDIYGMRPLILLATDPQGITVAAGTTVDASSNENGAGPAVPGSCTGSTDASQKSGGFGGTFLALGGKGGLGDGNATTSPGLPATALAMPVALQGGCPGGSGASNNFHGSVPGGGAVALVAMSLTIDGVVAAGGAGGFTPTDDQAGGNGGGAGGMIVLDAPFIGGVGELNAKGGGGGEGKGGNLTTSGSPGYNRIDRAEDGLGGSTVNSTGGDGGHGGPRLDTTTATLTNTGGDGLTGTSAGGGGGGGAAGLVIATSALPVTLTASPVAQ